MQPIRKQKVLATAGGQELCPSWMSCYRDIMPRVYIVKQTFLPALALSLYNCRVIYVPTANLKIMNSQNT